jgi:hypothetical protein
MGAICLYCGRRHIIVANALFCLACTIGLTHRCPVCKKVVPGSGFEPCTPCGQDRLRRVKIGIEARAMSPPWLAELFRAYCTSGIFSLEAEIADERIARAAAACHRIAPHVTDPPDLALETVYAALGGYAFRRVEPMIAYWATIGALEWDQAQLRTLIERDRIAAILTTYGNGPHGPVLHRFRDHLAIRDRKPITQRIALTAAATLLAALGDAPIADLGQRHVADALRARPRDRTSLQSFLSFLASDGGPELTIAKPRLDPAAQAKRLQADIRQCRKRLHVTGDVVEARALIAVLIARMFTLPLSRVLSLKRFEVAISPMAVTLWKDGEGLTLDEPLARAFREWISLAGSWRSPGHPWVFPSRDRLRPMSEAAVASHLAGKAKKPPRSA